MEWIILGALALFFTVGKKAVDTTMTMSRGDFLKKAAAAGVDLSRETGIPLTIIVTQAAHESNYGNSKLATEGKNLFGIKSSSAWIGPTITLPTWEHVNGKDIQVQAAFRKYSTWDASVRDWYKFLQAGRYVKALVAARAGDAKTFFAELQRAGYATDPKYAEKLVSVETSIKESLA